MISLAPSSVDELLALPETGMGFQLVDGWVLGARKRMLVFNGTQAIDLSSVDLEFGNDPATILKNGIHVIELLKNDDIRTTMLTAPAPSGFALLESRIGPIVATAGAASAPSIALPGSLVKHVTLTKNRVFHRFSAFKPDRRVDPATGDFLPGTYATTESEVNFVPTGFAAVGRFALPNKSPASHHYEIEAPSGTPVSFGTVAPAFGQAGGGVEAYLVNAVKNARSPQTIHPDLDDE